MARQSGIYIITNTVNGKRYIGSSVDIHRRWVTHKRELRRGIHYNPVLQRAWDKYGESAFEFSILLLCTKDDTLLNEQRCLDEMKPEYNICTCTTATMLGRTFTEEHKRKIGDANRGTVHTAETRKKMGDAHKGIKWSEEHRIKMQGSQGSLGYKFTDEQKEHLRQAHLGYVMPEEQKRKIGASSKGRIVSDEAREHMRKAQAGKVISEETRAKISATLLSQHLKPKFTEEHKEHLRQAWERRRNGEKPK